MLNRYCEADGRDPSSITRTMGAPLTLVGDEREAKALSERMSPDQRARATPATPARAAEILNDYVAAGAQGFTFRNVNLSTPESLELAAEVKKQLA